MSSHRMPYPGMRAFQESEWDLLFGQEEAIEQLLERLGNTRLVAVMGESGCGKSSIVKAGLIPELVGRGRPSTSPGSSWLISVSRPAKAPIHNLAKQLKIAGLGGDSDAASLESILRADSHGLLEVVRRSAPAPGKQVLVVIDQFEEIFRYQAEGAHPAFAERDEAVLFVKLLLAAAHDSHAPVYIVLTMRSEYLGDCSSFSGLAEAVSQGAYLLPKMEREQIEDAIVEPLRLFGQGIENKLLQHLLNETESAQQDGLPLLQHALRRTWEAWVQAGDGNCPLGMKHFVLKSDAIPAEAADRQRPAQIEHGRFTPQRQETLDIAKHLNAHLDEIFGSLSVAQQSIAGKLFKLLGEFDHKMRLMRRPTDFDTMKSVTGVSDDKQLLDVVNAFRDEEKGRSFLRPGKEQDEELLRGTEPVDISHEALLRCWRKCAEWVQQEAKNAEEYRRLGDLANQFGHTMGVLRGLQLEAARHWWFEDARPTRAWCARYDAGKYDWQRTLKYLQKSERLRNAWQVTKLAGVLGLVVLGGYFVKLKAEKQTAEAQSLKTQADQRVANAKAEAAQNYAQEVQQYANDVDTKNTQLQAAHHDLLRTIAQLNDQKTQLRALEARYKKAYDGERDARQQAEVFHKAQEASDLKLQELQRRALLEVSTKNVLAQAEQYRPLSSPGEDLQKVLQAVDDYVNTMNTLPADAVQRLHTTFINSLAISEKEQAEPVLGVLVVGDRQPKLSLVTQFGRDKTEPGQNEESFQHLAVSENGEHLVFGRLGGDIRIESAWTQSSQTPLHLHSYAITGLGFSTDDRWLATASTAGDIRLWQVTDLSSASKRHKHVLKGDWALFKAKAGLALDVIFHHVKGEYPAEHIALSVDKYTNFVQTVAYTSESGVLWVWSPTRGKKFVLPHPKKRVQPADAGYSAVATNPADQKIWAGCANGAVGEVDGLNFLPRHRSLSERGGVTALAWNREGTFLAVGRRSGAITVFERDSGSSLKEVVSLTTHDSPIMALSWKKTSDRLLLASGSFGGVALLWDMSLDQNTRELKNRLAQLLQSETSSNGHKLAIGDKGISMDEYRRLVDLIRDRAARLQQPPSYAGRAGP